MNPQVDSKTEVENSQIPYTQLSKLPLTVQSIVEAYAYGLNKGYQLGQHKAHLSYNGMLRGHYETK